MSERLTFFGIPVVVIPGISGVMLVNQKFYAQLWAEAAHELYPSIFPPVSALDKLDREAPR